MDTFSYNLYPTFCPRNLTQKDWLGGARGRHWQRYKGRDKSEFTVVFSWVSSMLSGLKETAFL